jgi:WD40 repeat protein
VHPFRFLPTLIKSVLETPVTDIVLTGDGKIIPVGQEGGRAILHPPSNAKYVTCNHADGGIRFHVASTSFQRRELNKTVSVHEALHNMPVTCIAVTDDGQRFVTGSSDAVVNVWFFNKEGRKFYLFLLFAEYNYSDLILLEIKNRY